MNDTWIAYCLSMPDETFADPAKIWGAGSAKEDEWFLYNRHIGVKAVPAGDYVRWMVKLSDADLTEYNLRFG